MAKPNILVSEIRFSVATGCMENAGTDSGVWLGFGGSYLYALDSSADDLERGMLDTFIYRSREDNEEHFAQLPSTAAPDLYVYFTRQGGNPGWYLDYVVYSSSREGGEVTGAVYYPQRWITQTNSKPRLWVEIVADDATHVARDCSRRRLLLPDGSYRAWDDEQPPPTARHGASGEDTGPVIVVPAEPIIFRGGAFPTSLSKV